MADLLTVQVRDVLIEEGAKQQAGRLAGMGLIDVDMLTEPHRADATPAPIVLVDSLPVSVLTGGKRIKLRTVKLVEQFIPLFAGFVIGLHLRAYIIIILIECRFCYQQGIVGHE